MINLIRRLRQYLVNTEISLEQIRISSRATQIHVAEIHEQQIKEAILSKYPGSLIQYGYSVYSQNDEDGIIHHIFEKLGIKTPNFIEFGVGATENNSHFLLIQGSRGVWIDGNMSGYQDKIKCDRLKLMNRFVTRENINEIILESVKFIGTSIKDIDFISMDLDGNDFYFIEQIVKNEVLPKLFCLEYNAKFRDALIKTKYREDSTWHGDDFFGSSLMEYCQLLQGLYTLIVCNITGANAFFIRNDLAANFEIIPPKYLLQPPRFYFSSMYKGHPPTYKYIID